MTFSPIIASQSVDISAKEYRLAIECLAGLTRDYHAYTKDERKSPYFQNFLIQLEQDTQKT